MSEAFTKTLMDAGVPQALAKAIVNAGYDRENSFQDSLVDVSAIDVLAKSLAGSGI